MSNIHLVLNAFRHHWNLHRCRVWVVFRIEQVLNAFRHHWNLHHHPARFKLNILDLCSTPFGIIGIFTLS